MVFFMKKHEMRPCWRELGFVLDEAQEKHLDAACASMERALDHVMGLEDVTQEIADIVFREACFRYFTLPGRTKKYQSEYLKKNVKAR